jgi:hypothetical protein
MLEDGLGISVETICMLKDDGIRSVIDEYRTRCAHGCRQPIVIEGTELSFIPSEADSTSLMVGVQDCGNRGVGPERPRFRQRRVYDFSSIPVGIAPHPDIPREEARKFPALSAQFEREFRKAGEGGKGARAMSSRRGGEGS